MFLSAARRAEATTTGLSSAIPTSTANSTPAPTNTNEDDTRDTDSQATKAWMVILVIILALLLLSVIFVYVRALRFRHPDPKFLPEPLKPLWRRWQPRARYGRVFGSGMGIGASSRHRQLDHTSAYEPSASTTEAPGSHSLAETNTRSTIASAQQNAAQDGTVNRNTSVRSIMTLPPYHPAPLPSERLIAREGERAGVDTVVEFPETAEEEETQREEDMEALFQIRQARRRELEEREARREERRLAREQSDWARLEQMRLESQARARARAQSVASSTASLQAPNSAVLFAEHTARASSRDRRVSSVSYAALGVARHDGSRIRADSVDSSDDRPLLDSAASMGGRGSNDGSRRSSFANLPNLPPQQQQHGHQRNISASSAFSHDEDIAQHTPIESSGPTSDRHDSDENHPRPLILTPESSEESSAQGRPPEYDLGEAPPYTSPTREQGDAPVLPPLQPVPSIEVTGTTPVSPARRREDGG